MPRIRWQDHVTINPEIHHGDPCISGTRIPVRTIVADLADGMAPSEIKASYPQLSTDNILGALAYAAEVLRQEALIPLRAEAV
jgi:uncharacterized protein (DUF433 family)